MTAEPADSVTRFSIPGGWAEATIPLGGRSITLAVPSNPDALLDDLESLVANLGHEDPYWAQLWPASRAMAQWVVEQSWPAGQKALELGCGLGLVGIAGLVSGLRMTFSDYVPLAVSLARENARRNGFPDSAGCVIDWRQPPAAQFPVILGSDIVYDPHQHEPLLRALERMLAPDGVCWLGDPGRYHVPAFLERAVATGFAAELCAVDGRELPQPAAGQFQLLRLRRGSV